MEDDDTFFSQNYFALVYVKIYKLNTYRKNRRVSSIVSGMVHYPAAILVRLPRIHRKHYDVNHKLDVLRTRTTCKTDSYRKLVHVKTHPALKVKIFQLVPPRCDIAENCSK